MQAVERAAERERVPRHLGEPVVLGVVESGVVRRVGELELAPAEEGVDTVWWKSRWCQ